MAKAKQKKMFVCRFGTDKYDPYYITRREPKEGHVYGGGYIIDLCAVDFQKYTGIKLKEGEVIELIVKRGKTVRKAK